MPYSVIGKIIIICNIYFKVEKAVSHLPYICLFFFAFHNSFVRWNESFHFIDQETEDQRI